MYLSNYRKENDIHERKSKFTYTTIIRGQRLASSVLANIRSSVHSRPCGHLHFDLALTGVQATCNLKATISIVQLHTPILELKVSLVKTASSGVPGPHSTPLQQFTQLYGAHLLRGAAYRKAC
jgi:hypothetical protein